jgi:hypothetical protein
MGRDPYDEAPGSGNALGAVLSALSGLACLAWLGYVAVSQAQLRFADRLAAADREGSVLRSDPRRQDGRQ